ncbi:glycosyltransferase [Pleomorphomonas koreensis]|uniref:glycosyltransferase n=1 Tax=Pleomorphomonas koreensis TaxID=257440 RepID=UPI000A069C30|nr:glycosyltransferase [Pleomorphomonas koreensis]
MKKAYVILDGYYGQLEGRPASNHLSYENFWVRYTRAFDRVTIITRVGKWQVKGGNFIEGPGVEVIALPEIRKILPFLFYIPKLILLLSRLPRDASYILRSPGFIPSIAWFVLLARRIPFGVEMVGDPQDALGKGSGTQPLRPLLNLFWTLTSKGQCLTAAATAYVTKRALQRRYPPTSGTPSFSYTSLDLHDADFAKTARRVEDFDVSAPTFVNVAMMHQNIKGQDVLLTAFAEIRRRGVDARLVLIGDGDNRLQFEQQAKALGVADSVRFTGLLPRGPALYKELDEADLFVLPSRQEGLPRAMIEAMARGLPCVASDVGGANELVPEEELIAKGDAEGLANQILRLLSDPEALATQSQRNFETAHDYHRDIVSEERRRFYATLLSLTEQAGKNGSGG